MSKQADKTSIGEQIEEKQKELARIKKYNEKFLEILKELGKRAEKLGKEETPEIKKFLQNI